ncbi:MAG: hypothetical protein NTV88_05040 [Candidatus Micrarchaeota archaeon]|nr:hypothetical protein [Candidatus Micrarchaeota archaeon]
MAENNIKKVELHIVVGCADARDVSAAFNSALQEQIAHEMKNGTLIDFERMSVAGTFVTPEITAEIKSHIQEKMRGYYPLYKAGRPIDIFVHLTAHGNVMLRMGCLHSTRSYHDIEVQEAVFNCGMMHAQDIALEMESMLLSRRAVLEYGMRGKRMQVRIETEEDIENLMKRAYGHNGTIAGNWVKSIVNLCTHPYEQKKVLRHALDSDPTFDNLRILMTAGVKNYLTNEYFRVDGNTHLNTFLDMVYDRVRRNGQVQDPSTYSKKQSPTLGLFHHSSIQEARATAVKKFYGTEDYSLGQVFAIGSMNLPDYFKTFGPYKVAGFFYGVKHLDLKTWIVMGRTLEEAEKMQERILNDPLMGYILKEFEVELVTMDAEGKRSA